MSFVKIVFALVASGGATYALLQVKELPTVIRFLLAVTLLIGIVVGGFQALEYYEARFGKISFPGAEMDNIPQDPKIINKSESRKPSFPPTTKLFGAALGVTAAQVANCMERNSGKYLLGIDYSLEENRQGNFGEIVIRLHKQDQSLEILLQECSKTREN